MCHPGAMDGTLESAYTAHGSASLPKQPLTVRLPDTSPRGQPLIRPLMCHHGPETHPHGHNSSSSKQWVRPDHEQDDPNQTLHRSS